jgi:translation initiation factor IF-2
MTTIAESRTSQASKPDRRPPLRPRAAVRMGEVEQRFARGRTRTVAVEVKGGARAARALGQGMAEPRQVPPAGQAAAASRRAPGSGHAGVSDGRLTPAEREARARAIELAAEEARRQAEEERRRQAEAEAKAKRKAEDIARQAREANDRQAERAASGRGRDVDAADAEKPAKRSALRRASDEGRRETKLGALDALEEVADEQALGSTPARPQRRKPHRAASQPEGSRQKVIRDVVLPETITVRELAERMAEPAGRVVKALLQLGERVTFNQTIDAELAELVVVELGHRAKRAAEADAGAALQAAAMADGTLCPRPPVVTVMGHVDHGKTSLLDALRESDVAAHEVGGITQHIGAYQVKTPSGDRITFIDTPGHAAFSEMRARGANLTDIVVLVVAADDGVMAQTVEAIRHAQAAEVPIVVAVNKIDMPGASAQRVKQQLLNHGVVVEELGGEVLAVEVSAKRRTNLDKLVEAILLQAELLELKASPEHAAEGVVIEARLDRGRGAVATLLVQQGTLRVGDALVAGCEWGRVRALIDERGAPIDEVGPGTPAMALGLGGVPTAGDRFAVLEGDARAREIGEARKAARRSAELAASRGSTLEQRLARIKAGESRDLPIVVKADAHGSVEAIVASLGRLAGDEAAVRVLHAATGGIKESDGALARASVAVIVGFNVRPTPRACDAARRHGVDIRTYAIIYELIEDVSAALNRLLPPVRTEQVLGHAEIRQVFTITGAGKVAGCMVTEGTVRRGARVRLVRDGTVIHDGRLKTLKRFKDEAAEVKAGYECGMALDGYQDIRAGDRIECYAVEEVACALPAAA